VAHRLTAPLSAHRNRWAHSPRPGVRRRGLLAAPAALALALGLSACSVTNPMTTQMDYDPSDGVSIQVEDVHAGNLVLLTSEEGAPGTLVGFVANRGGQDARVTIEVAGAASDEIEVPAGRTVLLGPDRDAGLDVDAVPATPGSKVDATVRSDRGGQVTASIPVKDGTLEEYADLVP
jgi:hypothetical protein